jgi:nicotinamidase-related amidase
MSTVEIPDLPRTERLALPAGATALVVVDMQNDFAHPDGSLFGDDARRIIPVIAALAERARAAGVPVFFTQDWHEPEDPEFALWGEHARAGTWGARIVDELSPHPGDHAIHKLRYDAFYGTSLDHRLRLRGVRHLVIVGTVANICVLHTAGSAALRFYDVVLVEDGISALTPFDKLSALRQATFLYGGRIVPGRGVTFDAPAA